MYTDEIYVSDNDIFTLSEAVKAYDKITDKAYREHKMSLKARLDVQIFKLKFDSFIKRYYNSRVHKNESKHSQNKCFVNIRGVFFTHITKYYFSPAFISVPALVVHVFAYMILLYHI